VPIDSTLGYESIARGSKTATFSIRGSSSITPRMLPYGWPDDFPDVGSFWTNNPDPDKFIRILDYLFEVNDTQWREDVRVSNFSSLMVYYPGNTILKSTLEKVLGGSTSLRIEFIRLILRLDFQIVATG
jgi:surface carbohydrate biosynthesis protein